MNGAAAGCEEQSMSFYKQIEETGDASSTFQGSFKVLKGINEVN